jgi:phosphoribosylformylglycinamidine (FGAM) synthase PurS component
MKSLRRMGFEFTDDVKVGKVIQIQIQTPLTSDLLDQIEKACVGLLANPLSEIHQLRV